LFFEVLTEVDNALLEFDVDGNGKLDIEEYINMYCHGSSYFKFNKTDPRHNS